MKMKKKGIALGILAVAVMVCGWLLLRPRPLGNINVSFTQQTTRSSDFSFAAEAGQRVKLSFRSTIKAGELEVVLYDSTGREVYRLDHAKALETFYTFGSSGLYTLRAEYTNFIGDFKVEVYPTA